MNVLERAKFRMFMRHPFFAILASSLEIETVEVGTCATDGRYLFVNPYFLEQVCTQDGPEAAAFILAHEAMHAALRHPARRKNKNPEIWNMAADYAVNLILLAGGVKPPTGKFTPLVNKKFENMTAGQIYALLTRQAPRQPSVLGDGGEGLPGPAGEGSGWEGQENRTKEGKNTRPPDAAATALETSAPRERKSAGGDDGKFQVKKQSWGDHEPWSRVPHDPVAEAAQEAVWQARIAEALRAAKTAGKLPAGLERLIKEFLKPKIDWRAVLANFVVPAWSDYGLRPDRRLWPDVYIPDLDSEALYDLIIAVDTSGSISQKELDVFLAELQAILISYPEVRAHVVVCDATVHSFMTVDLREGDPQPKVKLKGGGGTDFRPVFKEIRKRGVNPVGIIFLTDGYGVYPDRPPAYPVLWVLTPKHARPPWGSWVVLHI